jgi:hypothetical protein
MLVNESVPSTVKPLPINDEEYKKFLLLQHKDRFDWWAVFSVDKDERVWPFVCYKRTPLMDRHYIETKEHLLLATVAGNLIDRVHDIGGRFFINHDGVFYIEGDSEQNKSKPIQFVKWCPDKPLMHICMKRDFLNSVRHSEAPQAQSLKITFEELRAKQRGR